MAQTTNAWVVTNMPSIMTLTSQRYSLALRLADESTDPTSFREAEILGLRFMQEGEYSNALKGN